MATGIYDEIDRNPSPKERIKFGVTFLGGMGLMGLLYYFVLHRQPLALGLWIAGGAVFVLSFIPPVGRVLYILWMGLGVTLGFFTSPIILALVFLLLITPVGLVFKLIRRDSMKRKMDRGAATYWEEYKETDDPATYVKQF